jgi:hypothetical protein
VLERMKLLELHNTAGVLDHMLSFLGRGCEYCLALTRKDVLACVSGITDRHNDAAAAAVGRMTLCELHDALNRRGQCRVDAQDLDEAHLVSLLTLSVRAAGLPSRSLWYFMSTTGLCVYARDALGLCDDPARRQCQIMCQAAARGLLPGVQMLLANHAPQKELVFVCPPCQGGHCWSAHMCHYAARGGHLKVLQWLRLPGKPEGQCPWDAMTCANAAEGGHLEVLQWLRRPNKPEGQCPWNQWTCAYAAKGAQLDVLKWLRRPDKPEGQCACSAGACTFAAESGHLHVLQWLRQPDKPEGQCDWNAGACWAAAKNNHLKVLTWLRTGTDPCPWMKSSCLRACGSDDVRAWIQSQDED